MVKDVIIALLLISNLISVFYLVKQNVGMVERIEEVSSEEMVKTPMNSILKGTYISKDNAFYRALTFRGKSTVVIKDAIFGMTFSTSYERDENFIRIKTDKSDLLLEIVDGNTLVGEGFAKGNYIKKE